MNAELCAASRWAASGAMAITGRADGPPLAPAAPVASVLARDGAVIGALAAGTPAAAIDHPALAGERAAVLGLSRNGEVSCGGRTRLLACADGMVAVALSRPTDLERIPAWLGVTPGDRCWEVVADALRAQRSEPVVERARLLEIPCAAVGEWDQAQWRVDPVACPGHRKDERPMVLDLSALWAGPLCAALLGLAGGAVVKAEDPRRPDGARVGSPELFDLLNGAKRLISLDIGGSALRDLLERADVVITSARPRAFSALGVDPLHVLSRSPTVWVAITAFGWHGAGQDRVGFGDDVAAAAGLVVDGCFVADAVADPLCGVRAAATALECLDAGGSWFIDASLAGAAARAAAEATGPVRQARLREGVWTLNVGGADLPVAEPRAR